MSGVVRLDGTARNEHFIQVEHIVRWQRVPSGNYTIVYLTNGTSLETICSDGEVARLVEEARQ